MALQIVLHTNRTTSRLAETCRRPTAGTPEARCAAGGGEPSGNHMSVYLARSAKRQNLDSLRSWSRSSVLARLFLLAVVLPCLAWSVNHRG